MTVEVFQSTSSDAILASAAILAAHALHGVGKTGRAESLGSIAPKAPTSAGRPKARPEFSTKLLRDRGGVLEIMVLSVGFPESSAVHLPTSTIVIQGREGDKRKGRN